MAKSNFAQFNLPAESNDVTITHIVDTPGGSMLKDGVFKSPNFVQNRRGWQIDSEGNAEFSSGIFRGQFNLGGTTITIDNSANIQTFIDRISREGGGTLFLQPGTYTLDADIEIPGGVTLAGVSRDAVIIDCNTNYSVRMQGSDSYTTGTVTINNGDSTVTGSGTTWTAAMVGQYIYLGGLWYEIASRTNNTSIDLVDPYEGENLSGADYAIATVNFNPRLNRVTIQNSTGDGVTLAYAQEPLIDDIYVVDCGIGLNFDYVVYPRFVITALGNGVNVDMDYVNGFYIDFSDLSLATTGDGISMTNCIDSTLFNTFIGDCAGNGVTMTNCSGITLLANAIDGNIDYGIEMVSGNTGNQLLSNSCNNNGIDGIKLVATTDNTLIASSLLDGNGEYGLNIAASTCDNTSASGNTMTNNGTDSYTDSGTDSSIRNNAGANNNSGEYGIKSETNIQTTVADATSYYWGNSIFVLDTSEAPHRVYITKKGRITAAAVTMVNLSGGVVASNEQSSIYIRVNNTTDYLITSVFQNDTAASTPFNINNTSLDIPVAPGDYFVFKWVTPTWTTNPNAIGISGQVYLE